MAPGMLCSGTGGPPSAVLRPVTCPVCGRWWNVSAAEAAVVPRHFIQAGGAP